MGKQWKAQTSNFAAVLPIYNLGALLGPQGVDAWLEVKVDLPGAPREPHQEARRHFMQNLHAIPHDRIHFGV